MAADLLIMLNLPCTSADMRLVLLSALRSSILFTANHKHCENIMREVRRFQKERFVLESGFKKEGRPQRNLACAHCKRELPEEGVKARMLTDLGHHLLAKYVDLMNALCGATLTLVFYRHNIRFWKRSDIVRVPMASSGET